MPPLQEELWLVRRTTSPSSRPSIAQLPDNVSVYSAIVELMKGDVDVGIDADSEGSDGGDASDSAHPPVWFWCSCGRVLRGASSSPNYHPLPAAVPASAP